MNELALFAGAGGGILGGKLLGWNCVGAVEIDEYCRRVLLQRQRDGILNRFPIWDDVCTFDGQPWRGLVDVVSGGFPCQDISLAGDGAGIDGERSGLWTEMARIVGEVRPRFAFVENSPALTGRGLDRVLGDLSEMGYDARWGVVSAEDAIWFGGPPAIYHERQRIWIVAEDADAARIQQRWKKQRTEWQRAGSGCQSIDQNPNPNCSRQQECNIPAKPDRPGQRDWLDAANRKSDWWLTEPAVGRVAHGVSSRMERLRALGNGQVPAVAALAWRILQGRKNERGCR